MKKKSKALIFCLFLFLTSAGLLGHFFFKNISSLGPLTKTSTVVIEKGMPLKAIANTLEKKGFINNAKLFLITTRLMRRGNKLQAGEIRIQAYASIIEIIDILSNAKSVQYRLTIPEGLTTYQILQLVEKEANLTGDISIAVNEGELLPETYLYSKGDTKNRIIERMKEAQDVVLNNIWEKRAKDLPYSTKKEAIIMASIIEKETSVPNEYNVIAGVFINRLNKRMRLQTDPTVIYALSEGKGVLGRTLLRKDLSVAHPYNTYKNYGLPPGPICNPGLRALKAALNPAKTNYIFFVADGSGGHAFATTLAEHNQNVSNWKNFRRQRRILARQKKLEEKILEEREKNEIASAGIEESDDEDIDTTEEDDFDIEEASPKTEQDNNTQDNTEELNQVL